MHKFLCQQFIATWLKLKLQQTDFKVKVDSARFTRKLTKFLFIGYDMNIHVKLCKLDGFGLHLPVYECLFTQTGWFTKPTPYEPDYRPKKSN